jgi:hypothetical protein
VPVSFDLLGVISDQSGILLVPLPDLMLTLSVGGGARADLTPYFQYDRNSATTGRFTYPVKLTRSFDSLTIVASDNSVDPSMPGPNRKTLTIKLATALNEALELDSCLFYPNPVTGPGLAYFTFTLTRAAAVTARIYTLSGRLVRSLPALTCGFGFNRIQWDGLDRQGRALSNGVYLYRLEARATAASLTLTAGHTDKLIVHR